MLKIHLTLPAIATILIVVSNSAKADLIQASDSRFGTNSVTIDTLSGLAWLNLTFSSGLSYQQGVQATASGGEFAGFRPATAQEVLSLYSDAGIPNTGWYPTNSPSLQPILSLVQLLGPSASQSGNPELFGITATLGTSGRVVAGIDFGYMNAVPGYVVTGVTGQTLEWGDTTSSPTTGIWLVTAVPEPRPWLLMSLGGAVLLICSKSRWRPLLGVLGVVALAGMGGIWFGDLSRP